MYLSSIAFCEAKLVVWENQGIDVDLLNRVRERLAQYFEEERAPEDIHLSSGYIQIQFKDQHVDIK